jgi:adenylyltransferase/sulfurtransferase
MAPPPSEEEKMKRSLVTGIACFLLLLPALAMGAGTEITTSQLKAKLDAGESIVLVDTMPPLVYQVKHIPGAINIPVDRMKDEFAAKVPDKGQAVAFYCMGKK